MACITVDVDVYLDEFDDDELVEEVKARGYTVVEEQVEKFNKQDWLQILEFIDIAPWNIYNERLRDKILTILKS